jgi:hypothetical protein
MKKLILTCLLVLPGALAVAADHHHAHLTEAPAGVMGDHVHHRGSWMFSYSYMTMHMDGMRDGTDDLSNSEVLQDFMVTPTSMDMQMHMFGAMYAVTDEFTLMAMAPWVKKEMDHVTRMGARFSTSSEGIGDAKLSGIYKIYNRDDHQLLLNFGVSTPTGDIDEKGNTPAMQNAQLPYPMQLGSGTWDLLPGATYTGTESAWSWGGQIAGTVRLGDNDNNYTLGDRLELNSWGAYRFAPALSTSLRLKWQTWGDVDGNDPKLNPRIVPTADPDLQGGTRADLLAGVNFYVPSGVFSGNRLAIEGGIPVYENLDGPQMSTEWMLTANWQKVF